MYQRQKVGLCRLANIHQTRQLGDECIEMEANDMWEWDVTRDGRAIAWKGDVGVEANSAVIAFHSVSAVYPAPIKPDGLGDCRMLLGQGTLRE